jgi:hypothetical protein
MNRKIKSVSFNLDDPMENEMYEHSLKFSSFSGFIKRLIQNSLQGKNAKFQPQMDMEQLPMEQVIINPEHLRQLI